MIVVKYYAIEAKNDTKSKRLEKKLDDELQAMGLLYDANHPDFVIVIGGDGKLIRTIHKYLDQVDQIRFITIMTGTLGFYMSHSEDDIPDLLQSIKNNHFTETSYRMLEIETDNKQHYYAINEVRLENRIRTSIIDVRIDGLLFETFRGNGLVVSTPFGSSAYNRSLGVAIICDDVSVMQLTEIAGIHHNSYRSLNNALILNPNRVIELSSDDIKSSILGYDHLSISPEGLHSLRIYMSNMTIRLIDKPGYQYFQRLRNSFMF